MIALFTPWYEESIIYYEEDFLYDDIEFEEIIKFQENEANKPKPRLPMPRRLFDFDDYDHPIIRSKKKNINIAKAAKAEKGSKKKSK